MPKMTASPLATEPQAQTQRVSDLGPFSGGPSGCASMSQRASPSALGELSYTLVTCAAA